MMPWRDPKSAPAATLFVRLLVCGVFLAEGIQKFLYPKALGVGRFTKIGIPCPPSWRPSLGSSRSFAARSSLSGS